ncbi:alcohol dehydrogenase catalytic domain-containing protein [Pacificoceanicola onchidii]|uniref:alcohol dehydrogenase catalytic domain-containing protein n=1 Tax=Pacificoceanicola onchidii TaxID=2562685 RepID=UPI0010A50F96|nr:alcohol dehydrogenase catalytic domain-containing protein [Pacificoceanicola onchidii]
MKALIYEGVETLAVRDAPMPSPAAGEHLVRIHAAGICGSDMHAYLGHDERRPAPLILGHEAAGVLEDGPMKGRRVTINPLVTCGTCRYCRAGRENLCPDRQIISMAPREGAFAQFVPMPEQNLVTVPDDFPLDKAALCEPIAVSWHAARLALEGLHPSMARRAMVIGGGAIGLSAALALRAMGVEDIKVIEPNDLRRAFLQARCGLEASAAPEHTATIVIDAVGYAATRSVASEWVEPGGIIAHVGLGDSESGLDIRRLTLQEIAFVGTYTYTAQDFRDTAEAMFSGRLGSLDWFDTRPLDDGATAFNDIRAGRIAAPKVILDPWAHATTS